MSSPVGLTLQLAILGRIQGEQNDGASLPVVAGVSRPIMAGRSDEHVYEGVRLLTDDPDKLVSFVDRLLFALRVLGFKTRPAAIRECQGIVEIRWTGRRPKAFRDRLLLVISAGEHIDCFQVAAA